MLRPYLAWLLTGVALLAQTTETPAGRVHVKFRALSFDGAILGAGYLEGKELHPLDLSSDCLTVEQTYVGTNPIRFVLGQSNRATPAPEWVSAHQQLTRDQARMQMLSLELSTAQQRLGILTADARERGGKAKPNATSEVDQLKAKVEALTKEMSALAQSAARAQDQVNHPAPTPPAAEPKARPKGMAAEKAKLEAKARPTSDPRANEATERPRFTPLATHTFPADGRYLLLVHQTPTDTTITAIDDQEGAFPYGSMQFINLCAGPIEIRFGAKVLALNANGKGTLQAPAGHNAYAEGAIYTKDNDGTHLGYAMRIFQQDDVRTLYFILPGDPGSHGVRLKGIEERKAPEPPAASPGSDLKGPEAPR
jgi:hypothetical protein